MSTNYRIKILVVEDFSYTRKLEIKLLNNLGFQNIIEAANGESAISKLKSDKDFELVISDWNMPLKSGYDLLKWVRSDSHYKDIPFIMATAQAEKKEAAKAAEAGVTSFITKPYSPEELKQVIFEILYPDDKDRTPSIKESESRISKSGKICLNIGHIQITDHLVLGVLEYLIRIGELTPEYFELNTHCMPGWNPVQKSLEKGQIDAAFILAPIAMDLYSYGVPIQLILLTHKNGSICIRNSRKSKGISFRKFFKNKVFYIPHVLSIHHMFAHMFFREIGLTAGLVGKDNPDISFEVVPPVKIPEFMKNNKEACGFMVAQPIGAKTINEGAGDLLFLSGELWTNHPCCVVAMQQKIIKKYPDAVYEFTQMLVEAGAYIKDHPAIAAKIAIDFLDPQRILQLNDPVLESVLTEISGIKTDDLFPEINDFEKIQRYMVNKMGIGTLIDLEKFIDTGFAEEVYKNFETERRYSVLKDPSFLARKVQERISG